MILMVNKGLEVNINIMKPATILATIFLFAFSGAAFAQSEPAAEIVSDEENEVGYIFDPLEPVNRGIFTFNTYADKFVMRPVAVGYKYVVPVWGRQRVTNVFYNMSEPVTLLNSLLQTDAQNSFSSMWRFIINSTVGIGGMFDAAGELGLREHQEDFGQTLGTWGFENPPYLVLPLLGPSSLRDGMGMVVDYYTNPFYNGTIIEDDTAKLALGIVNGVDKRANILNLTDDIEKTSLDPYTTYRSYYMQNRENKIKNGQQDKENGQFLAWLKFSFF